MAGRRLILLVDAGGTSMEPLLERLRALGYRALRTKTLEQAEAALRDPRFDVGAAAVPPDLPTLDPGRALDALRAHARASLPLLVAGERPDAEERAKLRRAGATLALWEPLDEHLLRFQANRALAGDALPEAERRALRAPVHWPVRVAAGSRERSGRVYCVSARGAFVATPRPSLPRTLVHFTLPLPQGELRVAGQVVMTNVPGNLARQNLPLGMGVRFTGQAEDSERSLEAFTERRYEALLV